MKIRGCLKPGRKGATQSHGNIPVGPDSGLRFSPVHSGGPWSHPVATHYQLSAPPIAPGRLEALVGQSLEVVSHVVIASMELLKLRS